MADAANSESPSQGIGKGLLAVGDDVAAAHGAGFYFVMETSYGKINFAMGVENSRLVNGFGGVGHRSGFLSGPDFGMAGLAGSRWNILIAGRVCFGRPERLLGEVLVGGELSAGGG